MNKVLIQKLRYTHAEHEEAHSLPLPLIQSLQLIYDFFNNGDNHKLCLVFPTKEFSAQWLSIPMALFLIESDFSQYKNEITESLEKYKKGDWIILNNEAVVEWVGKSKDGYVFKHKEYNGVDKVTVDIKKISKIQPAPSSRKALSGYKRVIEALGKNHEHPIDKILDIQTEGNRLFQKNSICLISKHNSFENSTSDFLINDFEVEDYFKYGKIDDRGEVDIESPLLISNNLTNLALYVTLSSTVSKIIIDGYSAIQERREDFHDIDAKRIPTILITDLSEISEFEKIGDEGFDFYNFTKANLQLNEVEKLSPFNSFCKKLHNYVIFNPKNEICENLYLEKFIKLIHSIDKQESAKELVNLKILLIQLSNRISRVVCPLNPSEIASYSTMLSKIETLFVETRYYLGVSSKVIEEAISLLRSVIDNFADNPSEKCARLAQLMNENKYDYIICTTEDEATSLSLYLKSLSIAHKPIVISSADVNNFLLKSESTKVIVTGWAKTTNMNRLLTCFIFSEITFLFYQFERRYFNSLQSRNRRYSCSVKSTINKDGVRSEKDSETVSDFADLYRRGSTIDPDPSLDISDFELRLDNAQFSKFIVRGNSSDSVKAKRVEFKNDKFIYLTDTHGLVVLDNFLQTTKKSLHIHKSRIENLHQGDVIAFLKTEREVLNKIVGGQTTQTALAETNKWIELWKNLLKSHYKKLGSDFTELAKELKEHGCDRDPVTIRSWLFDELRIGPRRDDDLIAIAIMTNGTELSDNINHVRAAIRRMTGWRMQASDFVIGQLKAKIRSTHSMIQVNSVIDFEDLGEVEILEITELNNSYDNIDIRNVNRLLEKAKL